MYSHAKSHVLTVKWCSKWCSIININGVVNLKSLDMIVLRINRGKIRFIFFRKNSKFIFRKNIAKYFLSPLPFEKYNT